MARGLVLASARRASVAALVLLAVGCGGASKKVSGVQPLPRDTCGAVEYGGSSKANGLIASDLPMNGASRNRSVQMVAAIRTELARAGWRAGSLRVAFQPCDDSLAKTGTWDQRRCQQNARAYVADRDVVGVVGTYNSGCAAAMLPILNRAPGGGLAMVSPGNTLICLTKPSATCSPDEPRRYYPTGRRNYARVVPTDADQGAGLATFAKNRGLRRVFVLQSGGDRVSQGQATTFEAAARALNVTIAGTASWDPNAQSYVQLMQQVKSSHPQAVLLAGLTEENGGRLIKDKVAVLGPNSAVALLAPDGFAQQSTITAAGAAAVGMFASTPGRAPTQLPAAGQSFDRQLRTALGQAPLELYAPYAGQAAAVLLDAISRTGKNRAAIAAALPGTTVRNGIVGNFAIDSDGDVTVGPITVSRAAREFSPVAVILPSRALVNTARG